jgi:hypothetical protein
MARRLGRVSFRTGGVGLVVDTRGKSNTERRYMVSVIAQCLSETDTVDLSGIPCHPARLEEL